MVAEIDLESIPATRSLTVFEGRYWSSQKFHSCFHIVVDIFDEISKFSNDRKRPLMTIWKPGFSDTLFPPETNFIFIMERPTGDSENKNVVTEAVVKRGSDCCVVDSFMQRSRNLAFRPRKLRRISCHSRNHSHTRCEYL